VHKLFILTILLFYLLSIGGKWKVEENGQELFFIFLKENGISFLEENGTARYNTHYECYFIFTI